MKNILLGCICLLLGWNGYELYTSNSLDKKIVFMQKQAIEYERFVTKNVSLVNGDLLTVRKFISINDIYWSSNNEGNQIFLIENKDSSPISSNRISEKLGVTEKNVKEYVVFQSKLKSLLSSNDYITAEKLIQDSNILKYI